MTSPLQIEGETSANLNSEGAAAAAGLRGVRIVEYKSATVQTIGEVEMGT
jgi:hypothetical protein